MKGVTATDNAAILLALECLLSTSPPHQPFIIYTTSEFLVHTVCHWAADIAACGWNRTHGGLVCSITQIIQLQGGTLEFWMCKPHAMGAMSEAKRMAVGKVH